MKDFVSTRWIRVAGLVGSMALVWAMFIPYGIPWMGFLCVGLAMSGALWLRARGARSMTQVIDDVEAEPARAVATPRPATVIVPKSRALGPGGRP